MFIQTEDTPNPNAIKFLPGVQISPEGPIFFHKPIEAERKSNLAKKLFDISNVTAVFYGSDFITITKSEEADWELLKPEILMTIMDHIVSGMPILEAQKAFGDETFGDEGTNQDLNEIEKQIVEIIETRVRPSVAMDGGDIIYKSFKDGIVYLQLRGACSGCPSSSVTLKNGIESMLQHFIPEVKGVEAVEEE